MFGVRGKVEIILIVLSVYISLAAANVDIASTDELLLELNSSFIEKKEFNYTIVEKCQENVSCVRFCCENKAKCLTGDFFDLSTLPHAENLSSLYTVVKGKPCKYMYQIGKLADWSFLKVS